MLPEPCGRLTEFWDGLNGTCGPTAATVAWGAAVGRVISEQDMVDMTHHMNANGWADANGASTIGGIANELTSRGLAIKNYGYSEPFNVDWHSLFIQYAGVKPIIIELANGQALHDVETGGGENAVNLHYHYICIVGKQDDGYIVADGDNFQVLSRFQIYSYAVIAAAQPCAMIIVDMKRTGNPTVSGVPAGWTDDGATLRAPGNANGVGGGIRIFVLGQSWRPENTPLTGEYKWTVWTVQSFRYCDVGWKSDTGAAILNTEDALMDQFRAEIAADNGKVSTLQGQVASANAAAAAANQKAAQSESAANAAQAALADAQAKLAALQAQPVPVPAPADPRAIEAKNLLDGIIQYYKGN